MPTSRDYQALARKFTTANERKGLRLRFTLSGPGDHHDLTLYFADGTRVTLPANEMQAILKSVMDADGVVQDVATLRQKVWQKLEERVASASRP
jgi:hypothetical protein